MPPKPQRVAVILFNLGGPDSLEAVPSFLYNLFSDPNIIRLPFFLRLPIAKLISISRTPKAQAIYAKMGGKSPILEETLLQSEALYKELSIGLQYDFKIFICMRHAEPRANNVAGEVTKYNPDQVVLLPLYPHFSSTTTGSSIEEFIKYYTAISNHQADIKTICCYPLHKKFIAAHVDLIKEAISKLKDQANFRILFSAHSLPEKIIRAGDPYQWQTEKTVEDIVMNLGIKNLDYKLCYQSKVGPVKWLSPATEDEIIKAGREEKAIVIIPISFVSEHSETLVELDIDYKSLANEYGIEYIRVPALRTSKIFIESLAELTKNCLERKKPISYCGNNERLCPTNFKFCPCV